MQYPERRKYDLSKAAPRSSPAAPVQESLCDLPVDPVKGTLRFVPTGDASLLDWTYCWRSRVTGEDCALESPLRHSIPLLARPPIVLALTRLAQEQYEAPM